MSTSITQDGFVVETKISLLDGRDLSIAELLSEFGCDHSFWVYSCDEQANIVPVLARIAPEFHTCEDTIKVTLDNDEVVICSPDILFVLRDGTTCKASDLQVGTSLMPLYRKISQVKGMTGYEMVLNPNTHKWRYTHRLIASKDGRYKGDVVHHVNFNKRDNRPDNLEIMSWEEHTLLHNHYADLLYSYAVSEEGRAKSQEVMTKNWSDEAWREKMLEVNRANGYLIGRRLAKEGKLYFQTVDRELLSQRSRESAIARNAYLQLHTPEARKKKSETHKKRLAEDEEYANMRREQAKKNLENYNLRVANGEVQINESQRAARRKNALRLVWRKHYQDEYPTFEDYLQSREDNPNNHKVLSIECLLDHTAMMHQILSNRNNPLAITSGVFIVG